MGVPAFGAIFWRLQPYSKRIAHRGIWVESELLAEIEYPAKSAEGRRRRGEASSSAAPSRQQNKAPEL
jgi:hypothetical protein